MKKQKFFLIPVFIILLTALLFPNKTPLLALSSCESSGGTCMTAGICSSGYTASSYTCDGDNSSCCMPSSTSSSSSSTSTTSSSSSTSTTSTTNTSYSNNCTSNGGYCTLSSATCTYGANSSYDSACGTGYQCCKSGSMYSSNNCTSNGGYCTLSSATCTYGANSSYDSACGTGYQCCKGNSSSSSSSSGSSGITIPSNTGLPDPSGGVMTVLATILGWLMNVFLMLAVLAFVISGVMYLLALGDSHSTAAQNAKKNFNNAILAVVAVGSAYILLYTISMLLGGVMY